MDAIAELTESLPFEKSVKQVETLVKLCMQRLVTSFKTLQEDPVDQQSQRKASLTADNSVINNPEMAANNAAAGI